MLRKAKIKDLKVTYKWLNNPVIREFSFSKSIVEFDDHYNWFINKLESNDTEYYILEKEGNQIGSIRIDYIMSNNGKINYLIDPSHTGKGMGGLLLKEALSKIKKDYPKLKSVYGIVFKRNIASIKIFMKLGFVQEKLSETEFKFIYIYDNRKL